MGDLVNLKRVRKQRAKHEADKTADLNRVKFGRTKSQRDGDAAEEARAASKLDQHKLPTGDAT